MPRAKVAIGLLILVAFVSTFAVVADLERLDITGRIIDGERVPFAEADASDDRTAAAGIAQLVAYVLTAIGFLLWYSRAYRNVIAMGAQPPRYGTRWAVWYWFIPIANIFRPKQVMNDIWRGSDPAMPARDPSFPTRPVNPLLHLWWAAWLISTILSRIASTSLDGRTAKDLQTTSQAFLVSDAVDVAAALLAAVVVWKTTRRQEERLRRFEAGGLEGQVRPAPATAGSPPPPVAPPPQPDPA